MSRRLLSCILITFFINMSFSAENNKKRKALPPQLQKAYVIQKDAFIYTRADFDSLRISTIPAGKKVTISKKIYQPKTRFGTFYRIYITKPKKLKAYISEIDVVPRYIKQGSKMKLNPSFDKVKEKLSHVRDFQFNESPQSAMEFDEPALDTQKFIGLVVSHAWLAYQGKEEYLPSWFFGIKLHGRKLPIPSIYTDFNLMLSFSPPVIKSELKKTGYILIGDLLFKIPIVTAPTWTIKIGVGGMISWKNPNNWAISQVGAGFSGSCSFLVSLQKRLSFLAEGKGHYDISENKITPAVAGSLLVSF